jgi:hypothetical protein
MALNKILMRSDRLRRTHDLFAAQIHTRADLLQRMEISRYGVARWNGTVAQQDGDLPAATFGRKCSALSNPS